MGDNNNTVPNLSHLVSSGDSLDSQGDQQTKAQSASEHDVVDTFWDIPPITFSEVESAVERGEASDAAYAQAAATSMTAATSSTPVRISALPAAANTMSARTSASKWHCSSRLNKTFPHEKAAFHLVRACRAC